MSLPILYSFRRCPYAMRARIAIQHTGQPVRLREILLRDKPPCMLRYSAKGTVPVLVMPDGRVLEESRDIMEWCLLQNPAEDWLQAGALFPAAEALIDENDASFKPHLDIYKYASRYPEKEADESRAQAVLFLQHLDQRLTGQGHLTRNTRSYADAAIFPFIRQFAHVDRDWFATLPLPGLHHWLDEWLRDPLFLKVMNKYTPWKEGDVEIHFPDTTDLQKEENT